MNAMILRYIFISLLFASYISRIFSNQDSHTIAHFFIYRLEDDDYKVVSHQKNLFALYEKFVEYLFKAPVEQIDYKKANFYAQTFSKCANIYRRIATEKSLTKALSYHTKALEIRKKYLDAYTVEIADSYALIAATYNEKKGIENNILAIEYYKQALTIYKFHKHVGIFKQACTLYQLANAYRDLDEKNLILAIELTQEALDLFQTLSLSKKVLIEKAKALYNQGVNYHHLDNNLFIHSALSFLQEAKNLFKLNNDEARYAITVAYLANVYIDLGKKYADEIVHYLDKALQIQKKLFGKNSTGYAKTTFYLGKAYYLLENNQTRAKRKLKKSLIIQKSILHTTHPDRGQTLFILGLIYLEQQKFEKGIMYLEEAFSIFSLLSAEHYYIKIAKKYFNTIEALLRSCNTEKTKNIIAYIEKWKS